MQSTQSIQPSILNIFFTFFTLIAPTSLFNSIFFTLCSLLFLPFHLPSSISTSSPHRLFHLLELLATALTYTEPSLSDTNTCSEAKSECSIACSYYTQTNSLTHATSQTDKEIRAYTKTHTDTEPYTLLNAGANVTLQIFSFPLSCSWSVRRVWHSESIDGRGRFC